MSENTKKINFPNKVRIQDVPLDPSRRNNILSDVDINEIKSKFNNHIDEYQSSLERVDARIRQEIRTFDTNNPRAYLNRTSNVYTRRLFIHQRELNLRPNSSITIDRQIINYSNDKSSNSIILFHELIFVKSVSLASVPASWNFIISNGLERLSDTDSYSGFTPKGDVQSQCQIYRENNQTLVTSLQVQSSENNFYLKQFTRTIYNDAEITTPLNGTLYIFVRYLTIEK